ncbi:MAG TPA: gfo/Idh/MocA family oxidoreductase, partial [Candidatus Angelobacter sp.]|nr:gfo/Idh/MocA family oxidoreductase [Candidatus Angelobacter sp.]
MTDWGAHHNDIAQWGNGTERSGPVAIEGRSLIEMIPGGYTAASQYHIEYTYANGVKLTCVSVATDGPDGSHHGKPDDPVHGVKFEGTDGWIFVTRGRIEASKPEVLTEPLASNATHLYVSDNHMGNFFDCVRSRKPPICEPEIGHRSVTVCHLGVISMRLGRKLNWDPERERFVNDTEADRWLARPQRKPYTYDLA